MSSLMKVIPPLQQSDRSFEYTASLFRSLYTCSDCIAESLATIRFVHLMSKEKPTYHIFDFVRRATVDLISQERQCIGLWWIVFASALLNFPTHFQRFRYFVEFFAGLGGCDCLLKCHSVVKEWSMEARHESARIEFVVDAPTAVAAIVILLAFVAARLSLALLLSRRRRVRELRPIIASPSRANVKSGVAAPTHIAIVVILVTLRTVLLTKAS